tara:strand:+ start:2102 stop:2296 length:195 start_codon:yes stop_codon:yes gene_type:complete
MAKEKNQSLIDGYQSELKSAIQQGRPKKYIDEIKKALVDAGGKADKIETADKKNKAETTSKKTK